MKVKEMEVEQRPREKALRNGLESLNDLELVALIPVFRGLHHECLEAILIKS